MLSRRQLAIGGFVPFSTVDHPGCLSAVLFCQGCSWRCKYCHNPHLQAFRSGDLEWQSILRFLESRRGLLDSVVFSGGEATLQAALPEALAEVKSLGFKVALHSAGKNPAIFSASLPLLDWVAFDFKTLPSGYAELTGDLKSRDDALASLFLLLDAGIDFELRTTVHPELISYEQLLELAKFLAGLKVDRFALQEFRSRGCSDKSLQQSFRSIQDWDFKAIADLFNEFEFRPAC
ncbi:MAG: anaerobic ribonucleoside-triphosphate reductase activating protein [Candidatus Obscuribacterales bacterium]|nr:anaerobic ribonucleoside-triphosphate reductase activating protein [Candidatus Obscuribacterales bacterium]